MWLVVELMKRREQNSVKDTAFKITNGLRCRKWSKQDQERVIEFFFNLFIKAVVYHSSTNRVYTFFGTNSDGQNISSCEQFDIKSNEWSKLRIPNFLPGFDISFGSGIEVNED